MRSLLAHVQTASELVVRVKDGLADRVENNLTEMVQDFFFSGLKIAGEISECICRSGESHQCTGTSGDSVL